MPELPDVQVFTELAESSALRRPVASVHVDAEGMLADVSAETLRRRLKGHPLAAARRHGKHLFLEIEGEERWLRLHFGMTGELLVVDADDDEPPYTRLRLDFEDGGRLHFTSRRKLGEIGLVKSPEAFVRERKLGPDPWNDAPDTAGLREILQGRSGSIKGTLMNQEVIAGLGNVYVDEILFHAGIHPKAPTNELDDDTLERLHSALGEVLSGAVKHRADPDRMPESWLLPRRKEGAACPRCDGKIVKSEVSGRSTYRCDTHQKGGREA